MCAIADLALIECSEPEPHERAWWFPVERERSGHLECGGESSLTGLKLLSFSIWERRGGNGRNVTFPAPSYVVNGGSRP
jgi:hypothetical protein